MQVHEYPVKAFKCFVKAPETCVLVAERFVKVYEPHLKENKTRVKNEGYIE